MKKFISGSIRERMGLVDLLATHAHIYFTVIQYLYSKSASKIKCLKRMLYHSTREHLVHWLDSLMARHTHNTVLVPCVCESLQYPKMFSLRRMQDPFLLPHLTYPSHLSYLFLSGNYISNKILKGLTLPKCLKVLVLKNNRLTKITNITFPKKLKWIDLCNNAISEVRDVSFPPRLKLLDLSSNRLTVSSFKNVHINQHLGLLDLKFNKQLSVDEGITIARSLQVNVRVNDFENCVYHEFRVCRSRINKNLCVHTANLLNY